MFIDFFTVFAKFFKFNFFRRINLITGCYIISVFTNSTDECNFNSLFSFACHNIFSSFLARHDFSDGGLLLSRQWESDPHSSHYQWLVLPLNYVGSVLREGIAPPESVRTLGLQPSAIATLPPQHLYSFQLLEPTTICLSQKFLPNFLSRLSDLNWWPAVYKTAALPLS